MKRILGSRRFLISALALLPVGLAMGLTSCSFSQKPKENFLIIAVEELGSQQINCLRDERTGVKSGIDQLCPQSVKFSHMYTTSTMSAPAMASLLTGLYPFEHKLRNNGSDFLSAELETIAEIAVKKGYSTAFFSGGAPLLRKTGLQQGFSVFDDFVNPSYTLLYRNSRNTFQAFSRWLKNLESEAFFSVIYVPDLLFTKTETKNEFGEARNLSYESQLEEFDEALFWLIHDLKQQKKLDTLNLVVVGLNGPGMGIRRSELKASNLLSDRVQVGMLFKPNQKISRDQPLQWSIDENVSLADLGMTFKEWLTDLPETTPPLLPRISLKKSLEKAQSPSEGQRWILVENAWNKWQKSGKIRYSLRQQHFVYVHDQPAKIYNSLLDPLEQMSISGSTSPLVADAKSIMSDLQFEPFQKSEETPAAPATLPVCLQNLPTKSNENPKCDSNLLNNYLDWIIKDASQEHSSDEKESARKLFFRDYGYAYLDWVAFQYNKAYGYQWDVQKKSEQLIDAINLSVDTPELIRYKQVLQRQRAVLKPEFNIDQ